MFTQLKTFMNFCFSLLIISSQLVAHVQQTFRCPKTATVFGLCLSFASSVPLGHRAKDGKLLLVAEFTRTSDWNEPWSYIGALLGTLSEVQPDSTAQPYLRVSLCRCVSVQVYSTARVQDQVPCVGAVHHCGVGLDSGPVGE